MQWPWVSRRKAIELELEIVRLRSELERVRACRSEELRDALRQAHGVYAMLENNSRDTFTCHFTRDAQGHVLHITTRVWGSRLWSYLDQQGCDSKIACLAMGQVHGAHVAKLLCQFMDTSIQRC